jgi:hypothetical protein
LFAAEHRQDTAKPTCNGGGCRGERPIFEKEGSPPHHNDPYTIESVRNFLSGLLKQLTVDDG